MTALVMLIGMVGAGSDLDFCWVDHFGQVQQWIAQPGWLTRPSATASVTTDGQTACFSVDEPGTGMKWSVSMPSVWLEELPCLIVRYKAENLDTESTDYLLYADDDVAERQLSAIRLCDVKADGQWHVAAVDLTSLTSAESIDALAVQVQADIHGQARLWLDYVMLTDAVPDDAQWPRREAEISPTPDWSMPLGAAQWAAEPDWLGNPASKGGHSTDRQNETTRFRVGEPDRGMKWSCRLSEEISLIGHRYVTMRYCASGARPAGDYAVCALGKMSDGRSDYRAIVPASDLRCDGQWHRLDVDVRKIAAELTTVQTLAVQLQAAQPGATLEISELGLVNRRQESRLDDAIDWQPTVGEDTRFTRIGIESIATTPVEPWLARLRLAEWFSDRRITAAGIPLQLPEPSRVASTSLAAEAELEIPVDTRASEVYLLLMAAFRGEEEPAYGSGKLRSIRDVDRFRVRLEYTDGTVDECLPMDVLTGQFGTQEGLQLVVAAADPALPLRKVVVCDRTGQAAFAVAAASARIDGELSFPQLLEETPPFRVQPLPEPADSPILEVGLAPDGPPRWTRLAHRPTKWQYLATPSPLVKLEVDGQPLPSEDLEPVATTDDTESQGYRWYRLRSVEGLRLGLGLHTENTNNFSVVARLENRGMVQHTISLVAPWIEGYRLADRPEDASYLVPRRGTVLNHGPCDYRERYCGMFPVQFLDTFSPAAGRGLTLRTTDKACVRKNYLLKKAEDRFSIGVEYPDIALQPGESFQAAPAIVTATGGDWHEGFEAYRHWLQSWHKPIVPRKGWFREVFNFRQRFLWMWDPLYNPSSGTLHLDEAVAEARREFGGIDYLHLFDWGSCPGLGRIYGRTGDYSPFEHIAGGREALQKAIAAVQSQGVPVGIYIEGYLLQERGKLGSQFGPQWQLLGRDGRGLYWPESTEMFVCPGVEAWREVQASTYETKVSELGVDGMYIDQFGFAGSDKDCWSSDHGHARPSYTVVTERDCTERIRRRVEAARPNVAIYTEESPVDVTSQYQDGSFTYAMNSAQRAATQVPLNLFRFAVPDFKTIEILYCDKPTGNWATGVKWVFFNGEAIWLEGKADEWFAPQTRAAIRQCYRLLREYRDAFTTLEPVPLVPTEIGGLFANAFPAKDRTVYTFYNSRHRTIRGPAIRLPHTDRIVYHDAWHDRPAKSQRAGDDDLIFLEIGPLDVGCLVVDRPGTRQTLDSTTEVQR